MVGMEEILECAIGSTSGFASTSIFGETYFNISDYESKSEGDEEDEKIDGQWQGIDNDPPHFSIANNRIYVDESSRLFFEHVPIETFPKYVHIIIASKKLMIECLEGQVFPTFDQICEVDLSFYPFSKSHGCSIDVNDVFHNI